MKKIGWISLGLVVAALAAFFIYKNLPQKRFARHLVKARLYVNQNKLEAARKEYQAAYDAQGDFTPYVSLEVLEFENALNVREGKVDMAINNSKKFVELNPESTKGRLILANLAFQTGYLQDAFDAVQSILARDPVNMDARLLLALVRTKQGRLDLAEEQMRILQKEFPDSLSSLLPLATNLIQQGRTRESRNFIYQVLNKNPGQQFARLQLLDSYVLEGRMDSAYAILDSWKNIDSSIAQSVDIRKARLMAFQGKFLETSELLNKYRFYKRENLPALSELAILFVRQGQIDSALALYTEIGINIPDSKSRALYFQHLLNLANGNPAKALAILGDLTSTTPQSVYATNFVITYLALNQEHKMENFIKSQNDTLQNFLKSFVSYLQPSPDFVKYWAQVQYFTQNQQRPDLFNIAQKWYNMFPSNGMVAGQYADLLLSSNLYQKALGVMQGIANPTLSQRITQVSLLAQLGNIAGARQIAEELYKAYPGAGGLPSLLANFLMQEKKTEAAIALYEEELSQNPNHMLALNNLAWEYGINQKNLAKALPLIKRLQKMDPHDPRILDTMAWILAQNGKYSEALPHANLALHLIPDQPSFLYHLGYIYYKMGKIKEAKTVLSKADATKGSFEEKPLVQALLAEMSAK